MAGQGVDYRNQVSYWSLVLVVEGELATDFDLPFTLLRSTILEVRPSSQVSLRCRTNGEKWNELRKTVDERREPVID
jgi:hypothetical protein